MDGASVLVGTLGLGLALGLAHALDPDHLLAVSALVSERPSPRRAALVGLVWGLGHGAALAAVGFAVLLFHWAVPPAFAAWAELGVALMLVVLGAQTLRRGLRPRLVHAHVHSHGGHVHVHRHVHLHEDSRHGGLLHALAHVGPRPFTVGLVHGLAGSAALVLLVLGTIPSPAVGVAYVLVFGAGAAAAMSLVSALGALPLAAARRSLGALHHRVEVAVGAGGVVFGVVLAARLLVGPGMFLS